MKPTSKEHEEIEIGGEWEKNKIGKDKEEKE